MCGIFGIVNKDYSNFNKSIFNTLGIANDTRGGDSCGIFIDGKSEYGIGKEKFYEDFFLGSNLLKDTTKCNVAFGHCRKTSVGTTSLKTAQPVIITEDDQVKYVLMHNGTIYNYEDLAKKYIPDVDIKGMSDSQVMARIFYYKGYDALSEYNGGAVFAIADYREDPNDPKILFWKGSSKQSKYQTAVTDERPFYYIRTKGQIIFSSIAAYLEGFVHQQCWTIKANNLVEIRDNELYIVKEYSRKDAQQIKALPVHSSSSTSSTSTSHTSNGCGSSRYLYHNKNGDFMFAGEKAHGKKFCSAWGVISDKDFTSPNAMWCYFYCGILLYNKACFDLLEDIRNELQKTVPAYYDPEVFCKDYPEIVAYFSYMPLRVAAEVDKLFEVTEDFLWKPFTGEYTGVFINYKTYKVVDGKEQYPCASTAILAFEMFKAASSVFFVDKTGFVDLINKNYNVSIRL